MNVFLKVEVKPSIFNQETFEPKVLKVPFTNNLACQKTSKGWLCAEWQPCSQKLLAAFLDEVPIGPVDLMNNETGRELVAEIDNGFITVVWMFDDMIVSASVVSK